MESELVTRLFIATLLGGIVGIERSLAGKHAGMRTYALVSMGSALFVGISILAAFMYPGFASVNPLHIAGFVILGVGFIGSGLSGFRGDHPVELTTATGIWVAAGIGMASGFGLYTLAVGATVFAVGIFSLLMRFETSLRQRFGSHSEQ